MCIRQQGREDPWLFFEAKRGPRAKRFGKHWFKLLIQPVYTIRDTIWSKPGLSNFDMAGATSAKFGPHACNMIHTHTHIYIYILYVCIYIYVYIYI